MQIYLQEETFYYVSVREVKMDEIYFFK